MRERPADYGHPLLLGRAMHRRRARKSDVAKAQQADDDAFRFCDSLSTNPRPRLRFADLLQQSNPLSSYLIHHHTEPLSDHRISLLPQAEKCALMVVLLVPELAACQSALTSLATLRGVRIHRCQALKANHTFAMGKKADAL